MRGSKPLSIIIPSYNSSSTLKDCLKSVREQMQLGDELIVVDDCSKDDSTKIAASFTPNILPQAINRGPGYCRNLGAHQAQNEILIFIDSDVIIANNTLEFIRDFFTNHQKMSLTCQVDLNKKNNFFSDYKNLYLNYSFREAHSKNSSYLYGSLLAVSKKDFVPWPEKTRYLEDVLLLNKLTQKGIKTLPMVDYPIHHQKNFSLLSLLRYELIMGKYYAAYKIIFNNVESTTHVRWSQQVSIALTPFIILSAFYSSLASILFLTLLLFLNIKHINFCLKQRGVVFALKSCLQLFLSYCAYLTGCIVGILSFKKLKKCFI